MRILVVDDDIAVLEAIAITLGNRGFEVETAENGRDALRRFAARAPDLVLTDIIMPEKEGIETIVELRRLQPDIPIIAMSGGGRVGTREVLFIAEHLGADSVLAKPFGWEELAAAIRVATARPRCAGVTRPEHRRRAQTPR
jgi:DNA-binding response OmpR family regulator